MTPSVNLALLRIFGAYIIKRNRRKWFVVSFNKLMLKPSFETGPFTTRRDAIHYANNLVGVY